MKSQFLISLAANASRVILGFLFFWQVTQALGVTTLGNYLYVTVAIGYFGTLIDFGFNLFVLNTASRDPANARIVFARVLLCKLILTGLALAVLSALYAEAFAKQGALVTALFFAVVVLQSFSGLLVQFFKALGRFDHEFISVMLGSLLPVLTLFALDEKITLNTLAKIVLAVRAVVLIYQLVAFAAISKGQAWGANEGNLTKRCHRAIGDIRANLTYATFSIFGALFLCIDVVVMQFALGPDDVAIYGTAMRPIMAVILFFDVLTGVFLPRLARQQELSHQQFRTDMRRFATIMIAGATTVSVCLMAIGPWAITLAFGESFKKSGVVLQALSAILIFRVATMLSGTLLTVYSLQGFRARVMLIILPLHVGLNLALQPRFGIWGAVATLALSFLALASLNTLYLVARIRKKPN